MIKIYITTIIHLSFTVEKFSLLNKLFSKIFLTKHQISPLEHANESLKKFSLEKCEKTFKNLLILFGTTTFQTFETFQL